MEPPFDLPPLQEFQPEDVEEDDVVSEPIVQSSSKNPESSIHPEWREKPNKRARTLLSQFGDGAGRKILQEVKEPEYAAIDAEVRDGLWQIMDEMEIVAKKFFDFDFLGGSSLTAAFSSMTPETVKVIGCVASGGPGGEEGWRQLFKNKHQRHALVCAIIGNVIVEQVLQHVFFGGDMEDVEALTDIQRDHQHEDGFERNRLYAAHIRKVLGPKPRTIKLPHNFEDQTKVIVAAIYTHLKPILSLNPAFAKHDTALSTAIYKIVAEAGILSILMRLDPHTVYYLTPTFKEDTFSSKYMDCFNKKQMEATHPRDRHAESWPAGTTDEEKRRAQGDEPLTRITLMDGVTAYRRGGWETTDSTPQTPKYTDGNENKGIRCRVLTHGWVFCRWGRARKFDKGVPKDDPKVHGREWKAPGFVEFKQVRGVPQPPPPPPAKRV
ncbi:hypothetical protein BDV95DRAFT_499986 [Massariosphaeria phaeospora]|uniref:Uncharacterized protein n=1 Tax=Massariosphaeria phaeospora TaxID=100035 RepID=A0A7C8MJU1_9PLEO|nr:hypothetical protein BDV95DRAFT_499986 [Massariosphaeria phaeospora]